MNQRPVAVELLPILKMMHKGSEMAFSGSFLEFFVKSKTICDRYIYHFLVHSLIIMVISLFYEVQYRFSNWFINFVISLLELIISLFMMYFNWKTIGEIVTVATQMIPSKYKGKASNRLSAVLAGTLSQMKNYIFLYLFQVFLFFSPIFPSQIASVYTFCISCLQFAFTTYNFLLLPSISNFNRRYHIFIDHLFYFVGFSIPFVFISNLFDSSLITTAFLNIVQPIVLLQALHVPLPKEKLPFKFDVLYYHKRATEFVLSGAIWLFTIYQTNSDPSSSLSQSILSNVDDELMESNQVINDESNKSDESDESDENDENDDKNVAELIRSKNVE